MREHAIEQALKTAVQTAGGLCWKLTSPGVVGVPDRLCLKNGRAVFVEVKAPGCKPRPIQNRRIRQLRDHGFTVLVIDRVDGIGGVLDALRAA